MTWHDGLGVTGWLHGKLSAPLAYAAAWKAELSALPGEVREARQRYRDWADAQQGFWAESPASLATVKEYSALKAGQYNAGIATVGENVYSHLVALPGCAVVYGLLWALRRPIMASPKGEGLPSLGHLRAGIRARGVVGRVYGYALVGWTHLLGYGLAWVLQRPSRLLIASVFAGVFYIQLFN